MHSSEFPGFRALLAHLHDPVSLEIQGDLIRKLKGYLYTRNARYYDQSRPDATQQ